MPKDLTGAEVLSAAMCPLLLLALKILQHKLGTAENLEQ